MTTAPPQPTTPIKEAATAFLLSYARAMHLADPTSSAHATDIPLIAAALGAHYHPGLTAYSLGYRHVMPQDAAQGIVQHLERFNKAGIGYDVYLARYRVEAVSEQGSALCWMTWRIRPKEGSGVEEWEWENVYGYRRGGSAEDGHGREMRIGPEGDGGWVKPDGMWELIVSDNEIAGLLKAVPNFMEL